MTPNPTLISWIKLAAKQTGADPVALLATSLRESGGQLNGKPGDQGTSFGPFQFHIGGALGNHPPAWASTYPAVLNRAKEFARLGVRGGRGAAAVQRPRDPRSYAAGVDALLSQAHAILAGGGAGGADPLTPPPATRNATRATYAKSRPAAAIDILDASTPEEALAAYQLGQQKIAAPVAKVPKSVTPTVPSADFGTPSADWGGSHGIASFFADLGFKNGLKAVSEKRSRMHTSSGGISDHWTGSKNSYAYDLSNGSAPTPQMDATAAQIAAALGVPDWKGGVLNVDKNGYRVQLLYRTHVGGNHFNHVHVGVKRL